MNQTLTADFQESQSNASISSGPVAGFIFAAFAFVVLFIA